MRPSSSSSSSSRLRLSRSPERPISDRVLEGISRGPYFMVVLACVAVVAVVWIGAGSSSVGIDAEDHHFFTAGDRSKAINSKKDPMHRCIDSDDNPEDWKSIFHSKTCSCADPMIATKRSNDVAWDAHQKKLAATARHAAALYEKSDDNLDLVMIGDSIIERFNGTRGLGQKPAPEYLEVFDKYFSKRSGGGSLNGLALGASGDTSNNLLWGLQNGLLPSNLKPKAWLIMVGTNDMGITGCSKRTTLAGILHVAEYLHSQRPGARIFIHGLLPRSDSYDNKPFALDSDYSLGYFWKNILFLNREIKRFCNMRPQWKYIDSSRLFLEKQDKRDPNHDTKGALQINGNMMEDALHPSVEGYERWSKLVASTVEVELKKKDQKKKGSKAIVGARLT